MGVINTATPESSLTADYVGRRIYRATPGQPFRLIGEIDKTATTFTDNGAVPAQSKTILRSDSKFADGASFRRGGRDAVLIVDPGMVVKMASSRIELEMGTTMIAEGTLGSEVVFTSVSDDRFGAGGSFDTNDNADIASGDQDGERGDWGGLYAGPLSRLSVDRARIANAGGVTGLVGTTGAFNAVEIHQAEARVANTRFEKIANGQGGATTDVREGRGPNEPAVIYVVASQPILVSNRFDGRDDTDNVTAVGQTTDMAAININVDSLNAAYVTDSGRQTGAVDIFPGTIGNQGPLIRDNRMSSIPLNGMVVREQTLTTESVWDDTDMVHILRGEIRVPNFHTFGGLRLESSNDESLVVKLLGDTAGFTATGTPLDINDRIGGRVHIVGTPGFPVILTSLNDSSVGAGFDLQGLPLTATTNTASSGGLTVGPEVNNGTRIDNDVPNNIAGFFEVTPSRGGEIISSRVTMDANTGLVANQDFIFNFINYIDLGSNGQGVNLGSSTITMQPTLVSPDLVASEGTFVGNNNATVRWRVETSLANGDPRAVNKIFLSSDSPLGNMRLINYLDQDVLGAGGDILVPRGTPGNADFRLFTLDNAGELGSRKAVSIKRLLAC